MGKQNVGNVLKYFFLHATSHTKVYVDKRITFCRS